MIFWRDCLLPQRSGIVDVWRGQSRLSRTLRNPGTGNGDVWVLRLTCLSQTTRNPEIVDLQDRVVVSKKTVGKRGSNERTSADGLVEIALAQQGTSPRGVRKVGTMLADRRTVEWAERARWARARGGRDTQLRSRTAAVAIREVPF